MTTPVSNVRTDRLELVPSSPQIASAAVEDRVALGELLNCAISDRWPPQLLSPELQDLADVITDDPEDAKWTVWYVVDREQHTLVGNIGFRGRPVDNRVEIGYAMNDDVYGKGYATEAVQGLCNWALSNDSVECVYGDADPTLPGAVRVLEKAGFTKVGPGNEPGTARYELKG